jgi:hypothetical protein
VDLGKGACAVYEVDDWGEKCRHYQLPLTQPHRITQQPRLLTHMRHLLKIKRS